MRARGLATASGTTSYARRFEGKAASDHFRSWNGLLLSSIGLGTYLGAHDEETDLLYKQAVHRALELGCNVIDSAVNYRCQRSERAVGDALADAFAAGLTREQVIICTKGGFFPFDGRPPDDAKAWVEDHYLGPGIVAPEEIAADCHCMSPAYLENQLETSLRNLRLEAVDIYYIHNPETQLPEVSRAEFLRRLRSAFEFLERAAVEGRIGVYGTATWHGYRQPEKGGSYLSLSELEGLARDVGGEDHRFRAIQLPLNLAMPEALVFKNQTVEGEPFSALEAAPRLGLIAMSSGSIYQGQLARGLPPLVGEILPEPESDAQRALQFARSAPGVTCALVGMKTPGHVAENLALARLSPASPDQIRRLLT